MNTKHTPGPWRVTSPNAGEGYNVFAGEKEYIGHTVGYYPRQGSNERTLSREEAEANARLISLAPELLAQLESTLDWYQCNCGQPKCEGNCDFAITTDLIKKAKGEA